MSVTLFLEQRTTMCILNLTLGTERRADSAEVEISLSEDNLVELTRTIAAAHTARGRAHLARGEIDLALADLDIALGHDPHNREAIITRAQAHLQKGNHYHAYKDVEPILGLDCWDVEALHIRGRIYQATGRIEQAERDFATARVRTGLPRSGFERTHLSAGYHVVARFEPYSPAPDFLIVTYPLDRLSEALADADRFSYAPEDRRMLVENGVVDTPDFDTVVYEVRSVTREIQSYEARDDQGDFLARVVETVAS